MQLSNPNHLLIGLGGTGGKILKAFKKRYFKEFPDESVRREMKPAFSFLYVDSTLEMMTDASQDHSWSVMGQDASFRNTEFCNIRPQNQGIGQILDNAETLPNLKYIVRNANALKNTLGEIKAAAGQKRRAGRLMFASNAQSFVGALQNKYEDLSHRTRSSSLHVHIFAGLAGGTGSGSVVDAVALTRKTYPDATIDVYAMVPEKDVPAKLQAGRYHQNGYAALMELNAMNVCRWLPSDVETGEEHIRFQHPDELKQFSLILFSNVNANGVVIPTVLDQTTNGDTEEELLHTIVADTVFFRLLLPNVPATEDVFRSWSCENLDQHQVEFDSKAKSADPVRARTKAIATLGIKRIMFPEQRIMQHMSYTVGMRVLWQMQYNNFKEEGAGYVNEPKRRDYSEIINDQNRKKWMLDDSHLMLNERILDTDKKFETFDDFWKSKAEFYTYGDAKDNSKDPIAYIEGFCANQFEKNFRLKVGVEEYYKNKSSEQVLKEQSQYIVEAIERNLYSQWFEGKLSMYDLIEYCNVILADIKHQSEGIEKQQIETDERIQSMTSALEKNRQLYNDPGIFKMVTGQKSNIYSDHQLLLQKCFVMKTRRVALDFKSRILGRLRIDFEDFYAQMSAFLAKILKAQLALERHISDRTREDDRLRMANVVVEVAEDAKMVSFEKQLIASEQKMDTMAGILRRELVGNQKFAHFGDIAKMIDDNSIVDIADRLIAPQIRIYHDEECKNDKIIGINVLEQLKKMIDADPGMTLKRFAEDLIRECGTLLVLNEGEMNRKFNNNPPVTRQSMNRLTILVSMPDYGQNDSLKAFGRDLENAIADAVDPNIFSMNFFHSKDKTNEMTVLMVRNCFPIRALSWIPDYRREYDSLVNCPNEQERKQNIILLHSEGDGKDLPLLEGEGEGPKGDDLLKYFFLAAGMGILKEGEDVNEESGWCAVTVDDWGNEELKCISSTFIGLVSSDDLTSELRDSIVDQIDEKLKDSEFRKSERQAVGDFIVKMMQTTIKQETSGTSSPMYKRFGAAAKAAMEMVIK